jgi:Mn2+/Fe2+ NRAMP family transporter
MERSSDSVTARSGTRTAFRIVAGVLGVGGVLLSVPFGIISFFDDSQTIHRLHNVAFSALYGVLLGVALLACARRPEANVSSFFVAVASGLAGTIAGLASKDFITGTWFTAPIAIVVLCALHPGRSALLRPSGVDLATGVLALIALVPAIAFFLTQAELQRTGFAADPHWELHHYSAMAAAVLALPVCGFAASFRESGRRLGPWLVGIAALMIGIGSLLLSDYAGALDAMWAWLTLAWGIAVIAVVELRRGVASPS